VVLAVANRPGPPRQPHAEVLRFPHRMVPLPMLDISSTDIRQRVAQVRRHQRTGATRRGALY
jgi:nicotinic acid mononucleotide adenylyltransferase